MPTDVATGQWRGLPFYPERPDMGPSQDCPHCGRLMKTYARSLSCSMTRSLIRLWDLDRKHPTLGRFHVKQFDKEGARGEFGTLMHWGLVDKGKIVVGRTKRCSGFWAMTDFGRRWIGLEVKVPQYAITRWKSRCIGFAGPLVTARECVEDGNRFRYDELMGADFGRGAQLLLDGIYGPKGKL